MRSLHALTASLLLGLAAAPAVAAEPVGAPTEVKRSAVIDIPFTKFQLPNGLTVIFHEDHTQPLVATDINVQVGSRDEPAKRTGFAHLFEHLMFMGTDRVPEKMFDTWMEDEGGSNNAWTSNDRTDYHDVGPSHVLPLLLWMEADRLGSLGKQLVQHKLDAQREVVRNERRQNVENAPYAKADHELSGMLFPEGHPYHHPVIGSHEDLQAATLEDVREFFARHYVPSRMSLVVAGDFDPAVVRPAIERTFGSLPAAEPPPRPVAPAPKLPADVRRTLEDNITLPKLVVAWPSPAHLAPGDAELDLLAQMLTSGKGSRLYKALVYDKKVAQSVEAHQASMALGSYFGIEVLLKPGVSFETVEKALEEELAPLRERAVDPAELRRAQTTYEASFVHRLQSVAHRASMLNGYFSETGDPGYLEKDLRRYLDATADGVLAHVRATLTPTGRAIVRVKGVGAPDPVDAPPPPAATKPAAEAKPTKAEAKPTKAEAKPTTAEAKPTTAANAPPAKARPEKGGKPAKGGGSPR